MLSSARRAPTALRSLRFASSAPFTLVRPIRCAVLPTTARISPSHVTISRSFSAISKHLQEAVGYRADALQEGGAGQPKEYTKFAELADNGIISPVVIDTITKRMNIHDMTEVQKMTLNSCLDGSDVIAQAKTGTGKTLAFLLPIVQHILKDKSLEQASRSRYDAAPVDIRALIVSPTRELAEQIAVEAQRLISQTGIKVQTAVGGTQKGFHLQKMRREGCHLLVGTPGRINDLLSDPRSGVRMDNIETFVLDEADRLLDIGFAPAIEEIQRNMPARSVKQRQTLMFSATVPKSVVGLVRSTMRPDFKFVRTVDPDEAQTHERIPQRVVFLHGLQNQMPAILQIAMQAQKAHEQDPTNNLPFKAIVYFGSTNQVNMGYEIFHALRDPASAASARGAFANHPLAPCKILRINGQLTQQQRTRETQTFRQAESAILFSTDVTARGMDFPNVSHVIQIGVPRSPDDYIHRLGRTGRAGKSGEGWLLLNEDEKRDFHRTFAHKGINMENTDLESASLNMTQSAQLSAPIAKMLQMIEIGVKAVPYSVKASVYSSLLGVMQQQFPTRSKQTQIDMMNDLARYGWGMQTPPPLPQSLVQKLGYGHCTGIEIEERRGGGDRESRGGRGGFSRGGGGGRNSFDDRDPFGMGGGGKGVYGADQSAGGSDSFGGFGGGGRGERDSFGGGGRGGGGFGDRDRGGDRGDRRSGSSFGGDRRGGSSFGGDRRGGGGRSRY